LAFSYLVFQNHQNSTVGKLPSALSIYPGKSLFGRRIVEPKFREVRLRFEMIKSIGICLRTDNCALTRLAHFQKLA
jgi:hypothetical protein